MIDRQYGEITYECDACDETLETGESEFIDALGMFRRNSWRAEKVGARQNLSLADLHGLSKRLGAPAGVRL